MTSKKNKFKEIALGILTGIAMWVIGNLLSGYLVFGEMLELYATGILVFIFPLLFFGACIGLAKYSLKNGTETYFKSTLIAFFVPLIAYPVTALLNTYFGMVGIPLVILMLLCSPAAAVLSRMYDCIDKIVMGEWSYIIAVIVFIVPMLAGLVCSVLLHRKHRNVYSVY